MTPSSQLGSTIYLVVGDIRFVSIFIRITPYILNIGGETVCRGCIPLGV